MTYKHRLPNGNFSYRRIPVRKIVSYALLLGSLVGSYLLYRWG